jgi:hypothetical protein
MRGQEIFQSGFLLPTLRSSRRATDGAPWLFGVKPWDPLMLSGAAVLLVLAALIAAMIPARRAEEWIRSRR